MDDETADLLRRLTDRYPDVPVSEVQAVVEAAHQRLSQRPIQDFTPVLVERAAVEELRKRTRG